MDTKPETLVAAWFGTAYITLIFSILLLIYLSTTRVVNFQNHNFKLYAALPQTNATVADEVKFADARAKIIENFFQDYGSLLANYSHHFVEVADKYQLDYRWLPAIAMQESHGGKKTVKDSHNPFGYGIYGNLVIKFKSWEEAIEKVGRALRKDYLDQGLKTPVQIMAKYTPPSAASGGRWARGVSSFMEELR